jgi:hypothetical protein
LSIAEWNSNFNTTEGIASRDAQNTKKGKTQNQNFTPKLKTKLKTFKKRILFPKK